MKYRRDSSNDCGKKDDSKKVYSKKEMSIPLLAFTFFYSVSIFTILLSFYFWQWNKDIKPEKSKK